MGRKTTEEEAKDYLASLGIDPQAILDQARDNPIEVPDDEQIVKDFKEAVYVAMRLGELKGTPLVNALRALNQLADNARPDEEDTPEIGIDEILNDAGLPTERRVEIGRRELERLHARAAALQLVVEGIEAHA